MTTHATIRDYTTCGENMITAPWKLVKGLLDGSTA
jgi:hypothetical protein